MPTAPALPDGFGFSNSWVISEPLLFFGQQHRHVDPKTGLALYGPYSPTGQRGPTLKSIIVGIVGPPSMIADAEHWLQGCQGMLTNEGSQPFLYPHFPGFNASGPFQCELLFGDPWRESIKEAAFRAALAETAYEHRVKNVVRLYIDALQVLLNRDQQPNVVVCCIPQEVIDDCPAVQ